MNNLFCLTKTKPKCDPLVVLMLKSIKDICLTQNVNIHNITKNIITFNNFEKINPYNLWYIDDLYKICYKFDNNQIIRQRYYGKFLLTPIIKHNENLAHLQSFIGNLSVYQPFYPERFYNMWEFLQFDYITKQKLNYLHIGCEKSLGTIESFILYNEYYNLNYFECEYHCLYSENMTFDSDRITFSKPKYDCLSQVYKIDYVCNLKNLNKYDFISIDVNCLFNTPFKWKNMEIDLHKNLFYLTTAFKYLNQNGSLLIRLNMICRQSWNILLYLCSCVFKEHKWIRSNISNNYNSEIYLYLNLFDKSKVTNTFGDTILKNLYKSKVYYYMYLEFTLIHSTTNHVFNDIIQNLTNSRENWLRKIGTNEKSNISKWFKLNDLQQISNLNHNFCNTFCNLKYVGNKKPLQLNLSSNKYFINSDFCIQLKKNKARLNMQKRVMDTKPNSYFLLSYVKSRSNFITWEQFTNSINCNKNLKHIIKSKYNGEIVTNAWLKMYEILDHFPNLTKAVSINSFHICEAPGAFISALNHYLNYGEDRRKWKWFAQTLVPDNCKTNCALDDHFGLIQSFPDRWLFGPDSDLSGNITHSNVIKYYSKEPKLNNINFMTADAGIYCNPNSFNEQEIHMCKINMGQILCILSCLQQNGSAVIKTFLPLSEPLTISMVYILVNCFENVNFVKCVTSNSDNSEIYIILSKYNKISNSNLDILYEMLDDPNITHLSLLFNNFSSNFINSFTEITTQLINRQINSLEQTYYYYYNYEVINLNSIKYNDDTHIFKNIKPLKNKLFN